MPGDPAYVGGYALLARLGEGGMGRVYLARSPEGRWVAVKLIRSDVAGAEPFSYGRPSQPNAGRQFARARKDIGAFG